MADIDHLQMGQIDSTYRDILVKLKTHVTDLSSQMDAMSCVKWIQKLQTLTQPDEIKLRNYLLLQICNQIRTGYLGHPFINLSYLDQDLTVVANCCRDWETMCNDADDLLRLERSESNVTVVATDSYISSADGGMSSEIVRSLAMQNIFQNKNAHWDHQSKRLVKPLENGMQRQNFYQRKYEETLDELNEAKLKLHVRGTRSLEQFVDYLARNLIEKYQNATDELLDIEKSVNARKEFATFQLNFCSKFKFICGEFLNPNIAENLLRSEERFQHDFTRILCKFVGCNDNGKEIVSSDRATISTDMDESHTKYSDYLKRYIRKQQKQFSRKIQDYDGQIAALKNEIHLRDKKQSRQIIEMKCETMMKNDQKTRDQLSESINELESKYKSIVQQIFNGLQEPT